jgi:hypothetical protein
VARRLVLHLGSMKSGTSFVQNVLGQNKQALADQGVLFPGPRWRAQVQAVQELIGAGGPDQPPTRPDGPWQRIVDEVNAWHGDALISMEFLGPRNVAKIRQIKAAFPDTEIRAILTCRDLGRNVPAMWLESVQTGGTTPWGDYLTAVRKRNGTRPARNFWKHQDIPVVAARWAGELGHDHLTLVTVPQKGAAPDLLWRRFAEAAGFKAADFDLEVRANKAIGLATAQVLLTLNQSYAATADAMPRYYDEYVKHRLAKRGLAERAHLEPRLGLKEAWVVKEAARQVSVLRESGYRVVGDLEELQAVPVAGIHADEVSPTDLADAWTAALAQSLQAWSDSERKLRRQLRRQQRAEGS